MAITIATPSRQQPANNARAQACVREQPFACSVRSPLDGNEYAISLFAPHRFPLAIAAAEPRFANRYAVNLGAGDGISCNDPVLPLYRAGYSGLAIEGGHVEALLANLPAANITKRIDTFITPPNVADLLADNGCPLDPDFLKLDIDGYDGPVLAAILAAGFRPKVMQIEVQPELPPPLSFAVLYDPDYRCTTASGLPTGCYGASLAYVTTLARRYGYFAAQIDFATPFTHDVTLVDARYRTIVRDQFGLSERPDRELWLDHPPGYSHFREHGVDSLPWRDREDPHHLLPEVWRACAAASQLKHGSVLPFTLTVAD